MLKITIKKGEIFDNKKSEFISIEKDTVLCLEHSLVSVSKWESKWHQAFLSDEKKTEEQILDYIKDMTITQNVDDNVYYLLSKENLIDINKYIENSMTATTFQDYHNSSNSASAGYRKKEKLTNEVIYYWMIENQIPIKCETWHLNRLLTLIRVCNIKNNGSNSKMSKKETMMNNAMLNKARRASSGSKG